MPPERIAPELVERIPLDQLTHLQGNARRGDRAQIRESLEAHGQVEAIVVNRGTHTGVPNEIVSGNNRVAVMRELGWAEAAVSWVDAPNRVALNKMAIHLNKTSDHATWDDRGLADLMAAIAAESDLIGTGMTDAEYDDLMRATDIYGDAAAGFLGGLTGGHDDPPFDEPAPAPAPAPRPANPRGDGDSATASGGGAGAPAGGSPAANGYVTMSWTVLPEQQSVVREALRIAQSKYQTGTSAEALVEVCDRFARENR